MVTTHRIRAILPLIAALVAPISALAAVTARLDRDTIAIDESVRLIIESDGGENGARPDLSVLDAEFNVLGTSSNQSVSITNGAQSTLHQWIVKLKARSQGSFTIPEIPLGTASTPRLRLTVIAARPVGDNPGRDFFIETEIDSEQVYVQQQVVVTTRLFIGTELLEGSLSDPTPDNALISRLGDDLRYTMRKGDRTFQVVERRHVLFPQQSGELEIPGIRFGGLVKGDTGSSDPFYQRFFNQGQSVAARSEPIKLRVLPPADAFTGSHWLPAKNVRLEELTNFQGDYRVGQPITRTVRLSAAGMTAEQLPEILFAATDQFNIYADKPERETGLKTDGVLGTVTQSVAVVPTSAGEITLPPLDVSWWNTATDRMESAVLPTRTLEVAAARSVENTVWVEPGAQNLSAQTDTRLSEDSVVALRPGFDRLWMWTSIALLIAWMLTLWQLWRRTRSGRETPTANRPMTTVAPDIGILMTRLRRACDDDDAVESRRALLDWASARGPDRKLATLMDIVEMTDNPELVGKLVGLDQHLYAGTSGEWKGSGLAHLVTKELGSPAGTDPSRSDVLPPLYRSAAEPGAT